MPLRASNLNLLPLLHALLQEGSVAKAARTAGLSQPAMSGALARLRELLDDPLLVRSGRTTRLTARALELRPEVERACHDLEAIFQRAAFRPETANRSFCIAAPDYIAFQLGAGLITRLRAEAPFVQIKFVGVPRDLPLWLDAGRIDLAVCGRFSYWPDLPFTPLFEDEIVVAVSTRHPLANRREVSLDTVAAFPSFRFDSSPTVAGPSAESTATGIDLIDLPSQISVESFLNGAIVTLMTDTVARAPRSLVETLARVLPIRALSLIGAERTFSTGMFWGATQGDHPAQVWLRTLICDEFARLRHTQSLAATVAPGS